jgi:hypothetical protein
VFRRTARCIAACGFASQSARFANRIREDHSTDARVVLRSRIYEQAVVKAVFRIIQAERELQASIRHRRDERATLQDSVPASFKRTTVRVAWFQLPGASRRSCGFARSGSLIPFRLDPNFLFNAVSQIGL